MGMKIERKRKWGWDLENLKVVEKESDGQEVDVGERKLGFIWKI